MYSSNIAASVSTKVAFVASKVRTDAVGIPFGMNTISFTDGATVFYYVCHAVCRPRNERGQRATPFECKHLQEICFCPPMARVNNCGWMAKDDSKIRFVRMEAKIRSVESTKDDQRKTLAETSS